MGILDRFRREEHVHFERDQAGNVTNVSRERFGRGSRTPVSDELLGQQREARHRERVEKRQEYHKAYKEAFHKSRLQREAKRGKQAGGTSWGERIDKAVVAYNRRPSTSRRPLASSYSTHRNANPFGSMFDTGMTQPTIHKKKKTGKTKYTIVGGKAYPIIGTGKKSRKKRKKKSKSRSNSWDRFNAFGRY